MKISLEDLDSSWPENFTDEARAKARTLFFQKLALLAHKCYGGKMQTMPKVGVWGKDWFNVWYTPGVSAVSTTIRDDINSSYIYSNRANTVAIVTDSTRVLGDGDCGISGGLGVMEGKAFLMKYLAGIDAVPLCVNNRRSDGKPDADKLIDFVKMIEPSFGAVNLEDISKPNCFRVLDELREQCQIPVWHDDAQGTACVILAGLINALKLADKTFSNSKFVLLGAGAANTTIARFILNVGASPDNMIIFDSKGALHEDRKDLALDKWGYRQWELCQKTNPKKINTMEEAIKNADALIALSKSGPDVIKPEWIKLMANKPIVFACANPVPEIYPYKAKEAGAFIVATGRGDFPNQVNNSVCFPGILKGALLTHASKITDNMAIKVAYSIANFAESRGINPENIIPTMEEIDVFPMEAGEVAMQAIKDGVARCKLSYEEVYNITKQDILNIRKYLEFFAKKKLITPPPQELIEKTFQEVIAEV